MAVQEMFTSFEGRSVRSTVFSISEWKVPWPRCAQISATVSISCYC
uniref:Uncharacterized protein n=1 Tax=Anguilla anguilla TaxID=7936 RepID=A0A0E9U7D7_ANGAN